jgi:hypothetical protein
VRSTRPTSAIGPPPGGERSRIYPALSRVPADLFWICAVGTRGGVYAIGDADHGFAIMSVAKPFVFALVCQALGPEEARDWLGANATGLPFNSLAAVERGPDGRTNPMVNTGAIASSPPPPSWPVRDYSDRGDRPVRPGRSGAVEAVPGGRFASTRAGPTAKPSTTGAAAFRSPSSAGVFSSAS